MRGLLIMAICLFSSQIFAQHKTLSFKIKDLTFKPYDDEVTILDNKGLTLVSRQIYAMEDKDLEKAGFKNGYEFVKYLLLKFAQYRSLYPEGTVKLNLESEGKIIIDKNAIVLTSTGLKEKNNPKVSQKDVDELEQKLIATEAELHKKELQIAALSKEVELKSESLNSCEDKQKKLMTDYNDLISKQESFDVALNASNNKKLVREYKKIKELLEAGSIDE